MAEKGQLWRLAEIYRETVLGHAWLTLLAVGLVIGLSAWFAGDFRLDASADSLVLEKDRDLRYYRKVRSRYGANDFLVVTYTPRGDMFSPPVLADLKTLRDQLVAMPGVSRVVSILDVPLIDSPRPTADELSQGARTLESPGTDFALARRELMESPLYRNLILAPDGKTTALQVNLRDDDEFYRLLHARDQLRDKRYDTGLSRAEQRELESISEAFDVYSAGYQERQQEVIGRIREIIAGHEADAELHLGGVSMIASDMIDFVRHDLVVFGTGVFLFILCILGYVFRRPRWIVLSVATCFSAALVMMGYLGFFDWRVTVVSSNFISLLLIITLSLTIHLIVRFRELRSQVPGAPQETLVWRTVRSKFMPSLYTAVTTMVAFGSLLVSGVRPVIDFGWMMVFGIAAAFVLTFTLFPAGLSLFRPVEPIERRHITGKFTGFLAIQMEKHGKATLVGYLALIVVSVVGIQQITVENRFIDYFKDTTEIYRGMDLIDRDLGGTTPVDIVIGAPTEFLEEQKEIRETLQEMDEEYDPASAGLAGNSYWFNALQFEKLFAIHDYVDEIHGTGKVLSLATAIRIFEHFTEGKSLDNFELSILYKKLPDEIREVLLDPYLSRDGNEIRIAARLVETDAAHQRNRLLKDIRNHLVNELEIEEDRLHITGMGVLYNNVLQSLYRSQILTLGVVFLAITLMFLVLFRSWRLALLGIIPNMVAAGFILGLMGLLGIPLDIMTITIAAITIGIGVDDTIHYVHRFVTEFSDCDRDYWRTVRQCHGSIGLAMTYTSITIILGFSILVLSNFIPTIYFGILTGVAMLAALLANLTLLPVLLVRFRALGAGTG